MAAFNFPDPLVQQTVTNPITGSTYQWKEPPGKWVITTKVRAIQDIIYEGDAPPDPRGDYKLWYSTDTLELYFWYEDVNGVSAWVPTSAPITMIEDLAADVSLALSKAGVAEAAANANLTTIGLLDTALGNVEQSLQDTIDSLGQVTLQEVLDNGDTADRGAQFGGTVTAVGISNQGNANFKFGAGEGVVLDSGSTFEPMLELKSYSGPGERKEVFSVNARGNANLLGKLTLAPGESGNQAATYGQLATLAEQIEQINPAYERGKYNFSQTEVTGSTETRGNYNLVRKNNSSDNNAARRACQDARDTCKRIPDNDPIDCDNQFMQCEAQIPAVGSVDVYTDSFSSVEQIKFSKYDADGAKHEWTDVAVGQLVDIFNDDNDNYFVGVITAIDNGTSVVTLDVDKVQVKGNATGKARIKIFTLNNEINELGNYVRKTGDQMTGKLEIQTTTADALIVRGGATSGSSVFYVQDGNGVTKFRVRGDGQIQAGTDKNDAFMASEGHDLVTKKYLDNQASAPTRYSWKLQNTSSNPSSGHFCVKDSKFLYFNKNTNNGHTFNYSSGFSTSAKTFPGDGLIHIWKSSSSTSSNSWTLMQMMACYKYRLGFGGFVEIEFTDARGNWNNLSYEDEYWISVDGFFN